MKPSSLSSDALKPTAFSSAKWEARREQLARAEAGVREVGEVIAQVVKEGDQGEVCCRGGSMGGFPMVPWTCAWLRPS